MASKVADAVATGFEQLLGGGPSVPQREAPKDHVMSAAEEKAPEEQTVDPGAARVARRLIDLPSVGTPELLRAVRTVLPLDDSPAVDQMLSADGKPLPVQRELAAAADVPLEEVRFLERFAFYDEAEAAFVVVRTGEARTYANVLLRKGIVS